MFVFKRSLFTTGKVSPLLRKRAAAGPGPATASWWGPAVGWALLLRARRVGTHLLHRPLRELRDALTSVGTARAPSPEVPAFLSCLSPAQCPGLKTCLAVWAAGSQEAVLRSDTNMAAEASSCVPVPAASLTRCVTLGEPPRVLEALSHLHTGSGAASFIVSSGGIGLPVGEMTIVPELSARLSATLR